MSQANFKVVAAEINKLYGQKVCVESTGQCWFNQPCSEVAGRQHSLFLRLFDDVGGQFAISMSEDDLFVSGSKVGRTDEMCAIPFFYSYDESMPSNTWKLGNIVLEKYYTVLDMTPYTEGFEDYIHVGISEINPDYVIGSVPPVELIPQEPGTDTTANNNPDSTEVPIGDEPTGGLKLTIATISLIFSVLMTTY